MFDEISSMNPRINLPLSVIPEARDWKVGETYTLELEVEQVSINKDSVTFEIKEAEESDEEDEDDEPKMLNSDSGVYMGK